ncbi:microtubule-associated tyrosine carboxypeptidase 1-like isoform X1 [Aquarana catesbeiana]|uniref:microtubule-associated tyrosine carboxypeptidase 1-like isoform X1 n=1 Tax=Aquarana catesbeiana TaxID=8400 RepID=UPI003CC9D0F4
MVLDSGHQSCSRGMSSTSVRGSAAKPKRTSPQSNGLSSPATNPSCPRTTVNRTRTLVVEPPASRRLSGCSLYMSTCSWMRRSESTCTINSSGSPRGRLRSSGSLPSISRATTANRTLKKSSCLLVALRPTNVEQEKDKFFLSNYTHNPQFQYEEPVPVTVLEKYSEASDQFLVQALRILNAVISKYGNYENFESITGGKLLSKSQIWSCCRRYMQKEGCSGEVVVQLTEDLLSQAVMTTENSRPTLTINLLAARQYWLEGVLRHEIGTHYLRGVNDAKQPWHGSEGRKQFGLKPANPTEEGLASLHSVLFRKHPYLWRGALLYYTVSRAATCSFSELFQDLQQFVENPAVRWEYCVRAKRGQRDTAQPGCFSKDQVYLDGIIRILRHRRSIDFRLLTSLGKVSFEDAEGLQRFAELDNACLPHFMQDMERYHQQLNHIMETNQFSDEELQMLLPE